MPFGAYGLSVVYGIAYYLNLLPFGKYFKRYDGCIMPFVCFDH